MIPRRPPGTAPLLAAAAAVVVLILVGVAVVVSRQGDAPGAEGPAGTGASAQSPGWPAYPADLRPDAPAWAPCADGALAGLQCATLTVPVDYGDPGGAPIGLALARRPAGRADQRLGTLVVSPGGPGGSGTRGLAEAGRGLGPEVLDRFDLVAWDPRGTAPPTALACDEAAFPFYDLDLGLVHPGRAADEAGRAWGGLCQSRRGDLLPTMSAVASAYDLESLRRALGEDQISFAGLSQGSAVGLAYAERFPDHLRALLLDGVVDPSIDARRMVIEQAAAVERAVDKFAEWCGESADCAVRGDAAGALDRAYAQARTAPLRGTAAGARQLLPTYVNFAVMQGAADRGRWPELGTALERAGAGDGAGLARLADAFLGAAPPSASLAVRCVDRALPTGADFDRLVEETARVAPRTGAFLANANRPCTSWPTPPRGTPATVRAPGAPAVQVWGTTGDTVTPYPNASHVATMLERSRLVTLEGDRHTALGANECVTKWQSGYLLRLEQPMGGTRC